MLITGCSSGIGRATAVRFARSGWTVYATARRLDSIADLEEAGCRLLELDVTDEASMQRAVAEVEDAEGAVGALVNNAGYSLSGAIESVPARRGAPAVRDERLRPRPPDPARAAGNAAGGPGPDRQRQLDGRQAHVSGRRLVPRLEARRRGPQRRTPLRGPGLRDRRRRGRAGADPHRLRRCRGGIDPDRLGAVRRLQRGGRRRDGRRLRGRVRPALGGGPTTSPPRSSGR